MKKNMGSLDRNIRFFIALVLLGLHYAGLITGTTAVLTTSLAFVFIMTGLLQFCPLYIPFKITTRSKN